MSAKKKNKNLCGISKTWNIILNIILGLFTIACVAPFLFVVIISFTDEKTLARNGYSIIPQKFSLEAYKYVLSGNSQLLRSYGITIFVTVIGTILSLFIMTQYAYAISRNEFKYKKGFTFLAFFTMLFNAGLVPFYIVCTQFLHLRNTIWALILPMCVNAYYILILKTFFKNSIPEAIIESARIDGAGEFKIFFEIILPISLPAIATVGLFSTIGYWNDWFNALLFIEDSSLTPLQYMLMRIENSMEFILQNATKMSNQQTIGILTALPQETARMATVVLATVPIILAYPFFQKYFVKGLTVGAVKE